MLRRTSAKYCQLLSYTHVFPIGTCTLPCMGATCSGLRGLWMIVHVASWHLCFLWKSCITIFFKSSSIISSIKLRVSPSFQIEMCWTNPMNSNTELGMCCLMALAKRSKSSNHPSFDLPKQKDSSTTFAHALPVCFFALHEVANRPRLSLQLPYHTRSMWVIEILAYCQDDLNFGKGCHFFNDRSLVLSCSSLF